MKCIALCTLLIFSCTIQAQKPCEFATNVTDSLGTYKSTKDYLIYEKVFAGNASYVFNSIVITDGMPGLTVQLVEKSNDFIKARCFDKTARLYMQLINGKIVTLLHTNDESCGTMVKDDKGMYNRITTGYFMFRKDDYKELKSSAVSLMRIKFTTETADYILKKEFKSELNDETYHPEDYFIDYFDCIEIK